MFDINITIVNYKMREDIEKCLRTLYFDIKNSKLEIIIHLVDNSQNEDGIKDFLESEFPQVRYIDLEGNKGFGRAQNTGFKKEKAKYYLPLNPDIEFFDGQNTIDSMYQYMEENKDIGILGPRTLNMDGSIQYTCNR